MSNWDVAEFRGDVCVSFSCQTLILPLGNEETVLLRISFSLGTNLNKMYFIVFRFMM